jgi:hypothetical protein
MLDYYNRPELSWMFREGFKAALNACMYKIVIHACSDTHTAYNHGISTLNIIDVDEIMDFMHVRNM